MIDDYISVFKTNEQLWITHGTPIEWRYQNKIVRILLQKASTLLPQNRDKYTPHEINYALSKLGSYIDSVIATTTSYESQLLVDLAPEYGSLEEAYNHIALDTDRKILNSSDIKENSLTAIKILLESGSI